MKIIYLIFYKIKTLNLVIIYLLTFILYKIKKADHSIDPETRKIFNNFSFIKSSFF